MSNPRPSVPARPPRADESSGVWSVLAAPAPVDTYALHDAKNLLGAIFANIDWLRQAQERTATPETLEALSDLTQACRQLEGLLVEGLSSRQVPIGPLTLKRQRITLSSLVAEAVRRVDRRARSAGLRITVTAESDLSASLDAGLMARVLDNLLDNALRVSPPGAQITVHYGDCSGDLILSITDQGPGVPRGERERIFELYGTSPTLPGTHGTAGIGLAFCQKVAEAHGGRIVLDDRPSGASFVVTFPRFG